jgi:hypothetical protein
MNDLPIRVWSEDAIPLITDLMLYFIETRGVVRFCIGRTDNLLMIKDDHGCDEVISLYETVGPDNASVVEDALIKTFYDHPCCVNSIGENNESNEGSFVFLAVWYS